jgi:AraC-like DNA-binding protein
VYEEAPAGLPHVTAWRTVVPATGGTSRILPDGCMDLIWQDGALSVVGPDTVAKVDHVPSASRFFALRFAAGTGPAVLGVPAEEIVDSRVPLDGLLEGAAVRRLAEAADPAAALLAFARKRWSEPDPVMVALAARAALPVAAIADRSGLSPRHLQRRSKIAFGYAPKTLTRILRLQRALALARAGRPFADVAAAAGYADQAHLSREVRSLAGVPLRELI